MAALELYHRIFTNTTDVFGQIGWRQGAVPRDAAAVLSREALAELDDLLAKLATAEGTEAWALRRFAANGDWFACLTVSYGGFDDAGGRGGLLNHARIVRLAPDDPWLNPLPLLEQTLEFPIADARSAPAAERLQKYVDLLADDAALVVPEMHASLLHDLDRADLHDVAMATLWTLQLREGARMRSPGLPLAQLALAWAALPAGIQQRSSLAYGAADGVPVDVIWSEGGTRPSSIDSKPLAECVAKYLNLLLDSTYDHGLLVRDMNVRSAVDFQQLIDRATITAALPPAPRPAGKGEMPGRKGKTQRPREESGGDADLAELDRQQQIIYRSLKDYIDKRLAAYEAARPAPSRAPATAAAAGANRRLIGVTAAIVLFLVVIGQLLWTRALGPWLASTSTTATSTSDTAATATYDTGGASGTTATTDTTDTGASRRPDLTPLRTIITNADRQTKWEEVLAKFTVEHPALFALIVDSAKADQAAVPKAMRDRLEAFSKRLHGTGDPMTAADRAILRPILFEYAVKQQATDKRIDGNFNDINTDLLNAFPLQSSRNDINDWRLQSEVILRWIERNGG
jgi:hypothetical protein